jgi:hypothetical protein
MSILYVGIDLAKNVFADARSERGGSRRTAPAQGHTGPSCAPYQMSGKQGKNERAVPNAAMSKGWTCAGNAVSRLHQFRL